MTDRPAISTEELLDHLVERCRERIPERGSVVEQLDLVTLELELARSGRADGRLVGPALRAAQSAFRAGPANPWLYGGAAHLGLVTVEVGEVFGRPVSGLGSIDSYVNRCLRDQRDYMTCDLTQGALGLGVYGLEHPDPAIGADLVKDVIGLIRDRSEADQDGVFHGLPAHEALLGSRPQMVGWRDLGLAHGNAGIVAFLARADSVFPELGAHTLLRRFTEWLCAKASPDPTLSIFSNHAETPYQGARLAWCYGDLGAWLALKAASDELNDSSGRADEVLTWIETSVSHRMFEDTGIVDSSFCHGEAGLIMVGGRMSAMESVIEGSLRRVRSCDFPLRYDSSNGFIENLTLLEGDIGVALALIDHLDTTSGAWTRRFLMP